MSRMIEAEALEAYIERGNGYLFHVTPASNVEAIKQEGIRPGSELGRSTRDDFFRTRRGHVYLIRQSDLPIVEAGPDPRLFRVDLTYLDPALVDPDEDMVSERFADAVGGKAPERLCDEDCNELPGQAGKLADWAEATAGFDAPGLTVRSLEGGRRPTSLGLDTGAVASQLARKHRGPSRCLRGPGSAPCELGHLSFRARCRSDRHRPSSRHSRSNGLRQDAS
jgi:hypothetical protein